jgi:PAS domain S-box-containing protein
MLIMGELSGIQNSFKSFEPFRHGAITLDLQGRIMQWDKEAEKLCGYSADETVGKSINELFPGDSDQLRAALLEIKKGKKIKRSWKVDKGKGHGTLFVVTASLVDSEKINENFITASVLAINIPSFASVGKNHRLATIISSSDDAIIGKTLDGIITSWNNAAEKIYGYTEEEAIGQHIDLIVPAYKEAELEEIMMRLKKGMHIDHLETKRIDKQGNELDISLSVSPIKDQRGTLTGASAIARDITEKKQLESDLQQNIVRKQAILENISEGVIVLNSDGVVTSLNKATIKIFGYEATNLKGKNIDMIINAKFSQLIKANFENEFDWSLTTERELEGIRKDGSRFPLKISINQAMVDDEEFYTLIARDLTFQRKLEKKIIEASENEKKRLGRYLHDNIGQTLTGIHLINQDLGRSLAEKEHPGADRVNEISEYIRQVDEQLRDLARGLSKSGIGSQNLASALTELKMKTERLYGIQCYLIIDTSLTIEENNLIRHLYRITQEAIRNAVIHGKADVIEITIEDFKEGLRFKITDNGNGFTPAIEDSAGDGIGIMNMKYRTHLLGGHFDIAETENGVQITCRLPG